MNVAAKKPRTRSYSGAQKIVPCLDYNPMIKLNRNDRGKYCNKNNVKNYSVFRILFRYFFIFTNFHLSLSPLSYDSELKWFFFSFYRTA